MTSKDIISPNALEDKVILITGGGRGLGKAMATMLAGYGAHMVLAARTIDDIERTADEIEAAGGKAMAVGEDVTNSGEITNLAGAILAKHGRVDVLVNNAGMNARNVNHKFENIPEDEWEEMVRVNLTGVFLVTKIIGKTMLERGAGKIINIGSFFAMRGVPERICYGATKAGVVNMTRALAAEWAGAVVLGIDVSGDALRMAAKNADTHAVRERVKLTQGHLLTPVQSQQSVDVVISNPPYLDAPLMDTLMADVRDYEPVGALDGGADGLDLIRPLIDDSARVLKPGGLLAMETAHYEQAASIHALFE